MHMTLNFGDIILIEWIIATIIYETLKTLLTRKKCLRKGKPLPWCCIFIMPVNASGYTRCSF